MLEKDNFDYAQSLYSQYYTPYTNERIENKIISTFDGAISYDYFHKNNITPREFLNEFLLKNYPNEISVKSNFIKKELLERTNNSVTVFELNAGNSRLDLCKFGRYSTAYEIKTELDTPKRLFGQMNDYFKLFEQVYLICHHSKIKHFEQYIPSDCGIYSYNISKNGNYVFKKQRSASQSDNISPYYQLKCLTKKELSYYFNSPILQNKELMFDFVLKSNSNKIINKQFKICLKAKYRERWEFLLENIDNILEIDYQWFFKNKISPSLIYF